MSAGWGGRVSDKEITLTSSFLDKVTFGDYVLADKRFLTEEELATLGEVLRIPSFTRGKTQLSVKDVDMSRQIAHVRIHVERVTDDLMIVISGIANLSPSVVNQ